jgi:uncharacterized membrane protein YgdD (TMEM256/DUF423 family)
MIGAVLGGLAVAAGAYGAHAGAQYLTPEAAVTFSKAVRYQMNHALVLLAVSWAIRQWPDQVKILRAAGWLFVAGVFLFSVSLYIIALSGLQLGIITPFGGAAFIAGWFLLAWAAWKAQV